jgi:hypothetical protein
MQWLETSDGELALLAAKDMILTLSGAMDFMQRVRLMLHKSRGHFFGKKDLTVVRGVSRFV